MKECSKKIYDKIREYLNDYDYVTAPAYDTVEDLVEDFRKTMEG